MSDDNTPTRLDKVLTIAWAYAGFAVGALATIVAAMNVFWWFFP